MVFDFPLKSPPFEDAEISTNVTVSEEKITRKNGGRFDGTIYKVSELTDEELSLNKYNENSLSYIYIWEVFL